MSVNKEEEENQVEDQESQQQQQQQPSNKKPERIKFNKDELYLLNETGKRLGIDNENYEDLKKVPNKPEMSEEQLDNLINDETKELLIKEEGEDPNLYETMEEGDFIERNLNIVEIKKKEEQQLQEKKKLVMWLASSRHIKLHLKMGEKDGKDIYMTKQYRFKSMTKMDEFDIRVHAARLQSIQIKHNILGTRPLNTLNEEEKSFLDLSSLMIEIAGWRLGEIQAKKKLGMKSEDYARVDTSELSLALEAYEYRNQYNPPYRPER